MMDKLKPCPFCGGDDLDVTVGTPDREGIPTLITCAECGAGGPWVYQSPMQSEDACNEWNRRDFQEKDSG